MPPWLGLSAGLVLLVVGGELLVRGSARLAALLGISPLVIGLTVVAFGTSAPELAVSLQSVRTGAPDVAIGNVIGSNIFNILFILGISAVLAPLTVTRRIVWVEVPIVIAISLLALVQAQDGQFSVRDGLLLLLCVAGYCLWLLRADMSSDGGDALAAPASARGGALVAATMAVVGLIVLVVGGGWLVNGAVGMAAALGVSDVVVGLTIVAAGTSLPEVAASVIATLRGHRDMAIGNVLGSNIFNLTLILGTTAVAANGLTVGTGVLTFDLPVMVAVAIACLPIFFTGHRIARWEGGLFAAYYVAYTAYLVLDATNHHQLPNYEAAMLLFVLPLTAVTLVVLMLRAALPRTRSGR
jgi:cation:H+ antiporter